MNALCPPTDIALTRRARSIIASASPVLRFGGSDAEIVLPNGQTCTHAEFLRHVDLAEFLDGMVDSLAQGWCDDILTLAGQAPTYPERYAARLAAAVPRRITRVVAPPKPRLFSKLNAMIFGAGFASVMALAGLATVTVNHVTHRNNITLEQAAMPAFREWEDR
jgi:hypothetical protein